ncbi:hypothetical protein [Sphingobacterium faecale]|uniref:HTH cro/C1-type domain-containing protein n=1 Tax=Sphingobacterium faecale TaxID=2803775 RepID=A0ABS1R7H8_9SPHI|nr:hypothetical protein [Sphingobacterium faecale]MBL1410230.1 hypothetical protein [Sphingobacterium faecale]
MDNLSLTIKERILLLAGHAKMSKIEFFKDLGMSYANFKGEQKKSGLSSDALLKVFSKYPEINPSWLLLGEGEMVRSQSRKDVIVDGTESARQGQKMIDAEMSFVGIQTQLIKEFKTLLNLVTEQTLYIMELEKRVEILEKKGKDEKKKKKKK